MSCSPRFAPWALCALVLASAPAARADQAYGFDSGAQGWQVSAGDATQTWLAAGGNTGGYLRLDDLTTATDFVLQAPAAALGNLSAYLGGSLSFDAKNLDGVAADWSDFGRITLTSGALSVTVDGVPADGQPPADGQWHRYTLALSTTQFGPNLAAVLANVDGLSIKAEFHQGLGDAIGIDNLQLTSAVPEPASAVLMLAGTLALVGMRRRRR